MLENSVLAAPINVTSMVLVVMVEPVSVLNVAFCITAVDTTNVEFTTLEFAVALRTVNVLPVTLFRFRLLVHFCIPVELTANT
jgi:hypothetical protein